MTRNRQLLAIILWASSCKHGAGPASPQAIYEGQSIDALVLSQSFVQTVSPCRYHFTNLFADALSEGLLRNGALTGLGTDNPAGKKLATDSLYFQGVRIASILDWELGQRLKDRDLGCLPEEVGLELAALPQDYAVSMTHPFPEEVTKIKKAAAEINPSLGEFTVVSRETPSSLGRWPASLAHPPAHVEALRRGVADKLKFAIAAVAQTDSELQRLKGLAAAFSPLLIAFQGNFRGPPTAKFYTEAYLPPFYELAASDWDKVLTWQLTRGLKKRPLKLPISISVATLTHVGYLSDSEPDSQPLIKVQVAKNFISPDLIQTRIIFGRLAAAGPEKGAVPMDFKNPNDAFYISFYPNLTVADGDSSQVRAMKERFNAIANPVKIDARIHQLTLYLKRPAVPAVAGADALLMKPRFSLKDSDISFRMHIYTSDEGEKKTLTGLGFNCQPQPGQSESHCFFDFGAYTDLRDFVLKDDQGVAKGGIGAAIAARFKALLNDVTRLNVKFVLDWQMNDIEAAIDKELAAIFEDIVGGQVENRRKVSDRIEARLFGGDSK